MACLICAMTGVAQEQAENTPEDPDAEKQHALVEPPPYEQGPAKKATVHQVRGPGRN